MGDSGFYVTLPSNACSLIFPQNTISSFTISLARPLDLPGAWEVGLAEIQYPHSWNNITTDVKFEISNGIKTWPFLLKGGYYSSIPELLESMNSLILSCRDPPEVALHYNSITRKVRLKSETQHTLSVGAELSYILGMAPDRHVKKMAFTADITGGFNALYIYMDIVEHQMVGDFYVPLLRCVPVRGQNNEYINICYDKPHYIPVSKHHIDTIAVEIKTDQNKNVPFRFGKLIVKLHFRPRRNLLI